MSAAPRQPSKNDPTLQQILEAAHREFPQSQQRGSHYPLNFALKSGRVREHRRAAEVLATQTNPAQRADLLVRALLLFDELSAAIKDNPELAKCSVAELCKRAQEGAPAPAPRKGKK